MSDYFENIEPKVGTNWSMTRRHILTVPLAYPGATWNGYGTACGRSITAYDPTDESVPSDIKGADISGLPWCKACEKKKP